MCSGPQDPQTLWHVIILMRGNRKARFYVDILQNLQQLKEAITKEVRPIDTDLLERVCNFEKRLQQCIAENGRHLPDIIFRA